MPRVRLRIKLSSDSLIELSTEFSEEEFWILSSHQSEETVSLLIGAEVSSVASLVQFIANSPGMPPFDILGVDERSVLLKLGIPVPKFYRIIVSSGNLVHYPLVLRDGWILCELLTSQNLLSTLKDELDTAEVAYELESIIQSGESDDLLTEQQRQFVLEAIGRGYYDHPRTYSLTELASDLDVSKSTASVVLHRAEGKLIKHFFGRYGT